MSKIFLSPLCIVSAFLALSPFVCLANDGTSLSINGEDQLQGIASAVYTATSKDGDVTSCNWSITDPQKTDPTFTGPLAEIKKQGENCYLTFHCFGSITLCCSAQVDVKGTIKNPDATKRVSCVSLPESDSPTLNIVGDDEVTTGETLQYVAEYKIPKGPPDITWTYPVNQTHEGKTVDITFSDLGSFNLHCVLECTDIQGNDLDPIPKDKDIKVLPLINLTAMRASYEHSTVANISGEEIVKIHYNIDDDDESYKSDDEDMGADCLQTAFKQNNTNPDDDLCKLQISFGNNVNLNNITDGTLFIEVTKGLRLWWNTMRAAEADIFLGKKDKDEQIALSFAVPAEKTKIIDILNNGLYVEGLAPDYGYIKIRFGSKKLKLPYRCCAVGEPKDQPNLTLRQSFKDDFDDLVDCEWCIKELSNPTGIEQHNCVAYAIDPQRVLYNAYSKINPFNGSFRVVPDANSLVASFDTYDDDEDPWFDDPFIYHVFFTQSNWNLLNQVYKDLFNDRTVTPYYNFFNGGLNFAGYSAEYEDLLKDVLENDSGRMTFKARITTMKIFNRGSSTGFIDNFFEFPDFAPANNNHVFTHCGTNEKNKAIVYYTGKSQSGHHAARALSWAPECDKIDNMDPGWEIFVSKDGERKELLIHRIEQISCKYGEVSNAYK